MGIGMTLNMLNALERMSETVRGFLFERPSCIVGLVLTGLNFCGVYLKM